MFGQIVSSKDTKKYKMKKISLPVNVCRSKTPSALFSGPYSLGSTAFGIRRGSKANMLLPCLVQQ